jgi:hypothetical protein
MSREVRYECANCFGLISWVGEYARRDPLRKHLACSCAPITDYIHESGFSPDAEVARARRAA